MKYGGQPQFPQPATSTKPLLERRPLSFYVDPGLPGVITTPYRPHSLNLALPTTYSSLWGDYFGVWAWHAGTPTGPATPTGQRKEVAPPRPARVRLVLQALVGLLPTLLAVVGWLAFARSSLHAARRGWRSRCCRRSASSRYLYFAVAYSYAALPDGDLLKATYMLTTTAGWALGFGYALDRLRGRLWWPTIALLARRRARRAAVPALLSAAAAVRAASSMSSRKTSSPGRGCQPSSATIRPGRRRSPSGRRADEGRVDDDRRLARVGERAPTTRAGRRRRADHASSKPASANARSASSQTWCSRPVPST